MSMEAPAEVQDQLRHALDEAGLGQHFDEVARLMRPGMELIAEGAAREPGSSRFGGEPDLPTEVSWPSEAGVALTFLAQINWEDVRAAFGRSGWSTPQNACDPEGLLPESGLLQFFCSWDGYQASPSDDGAWVLYHRKGVTLSKASVPSGLRPPAHRLKESGIRFDPKWDFPSCDEICSQDLPDSKAKWEDETWMTIWEAMEGRRSRVEDTHRFLGYAQQIQGGQQEQCAEMLMREGLGLADIPPAASGFGLGSLIRSLFGKAKRSVALPPIPESEVQAMRLLFQLTSDDRIDSNWGDCGSNYFWMSEPDLRALRFERACWIAECY